VPGPLLTALRPLPSPRAPLVLLADTGLVRARAGGWHLLADAGAPCPDELPAHAHADTLSCVLHLDGVPVLIDTGTSTYAAGPERGYERSTAAHNTLEIDGADSTEVWGAFRAGRRARVRGRAAAQQPGQVTIEAAHDGYRHLPGRPIHRRHWTLTSDGLHILDEVTGTGRHALALRWHLTPSAAVALSGATAAVTTTAGPLTMTVAARTPFEINLEHGPVAIGFDHQVQAPVLVTRLTTTLPAVITTTWRRAPA
jgi:uncharacterized heparinase superfamily protein